MTKDATPNEAIWLHLVKHYSNADQHLESVLQAGFIEAEATFSIVLNYSTRVHL